MKKSKKQLSIKPKAGALPVAPKAKCIALIGDLVHSRQLLQRPLAQEDLHNVLEHCNKTYRNTILSKFIITAGDEFQGLLKSAVSIPDIIWDIEMLYKFTDVRFGLGFGVLKTKLNKTAIGMDGPVWYAARDAIKKAAKHKFGGGVFVGFKNNGDIILNGFARLLYYHRKTLTDKQRMVIGLLRQGYSQSEIAGKLFVSKPVVSVQAQSAGWDAYQEGENAWRNVLGLYDLSKEWESHE